MSAIIKQDTSIRIRLTYWASFYICWYLSIYGVSNHHPLLGPWAIFSVIVLSLIFRYKNTFPQLPFILIVSLIGSITDSLSPLWGLVSFSSSPEISNIYPIWLVSLWAFFALGFEIMFSQLASRLLLSSFVGLVGGPLSLYWAKRFEAVHFLKPTLTVLVLNGLEWAILFPSFLIIYKKLYLTPSRSL